MPIKSVKMKISKNKKMRFFLMSQGSLNPRIRFLGKKLWPVARVQTEIQTHTKVTRGHPFRVSGVFPSTYHQGSAQYFFNYVFACSRIMLPASNSSMDFRIKLPFDLYICILYPLYWFKMLLYSSLFNYKESKDVLLFSCFVVVCTNRITNV